MKDPLLQEYEYLMEKNFIGIVYRTIILGRITKTIDDNLSEKLLNDATNLIMKLTKWYERASKAKNNE